MEWRPFTSKSILGSTFTWFHWRLDPFWQLQYQLESWFLMDFMSFQSTLSPGWKLAGKSATANVSMCAHPSENVNEARNAIPFAGDWRWSFCCKDHAVLCREAKPVTSLEVVESCGDWGLWWSYLVTCWTFVWLLVASCFVEGFWTSHGKVSVEIGMLPDGVDTDPNPLIRSLWLEGSIPFIPKRYLWS